MKGFRGWLLMVVVVALVAGLPPAGTGTVGPALAQPVDEIDDESSLDAEDVRAPTGGDEDEPRPERRRDYPDPTSVDTPEDFGLPVAPGDSWDLPVPLEPGRPAEAPGSPFRLRVDDARLRGSGKGRVAVDLQQPRDIPGLFSPLFDVDFVDASDRVIEPVTPATLEVDVSGYALGFYGDLARRLEVRWYEDCVDVAVSEEGDGGEAREAPGMVATRCGRVVALPTTFDAESLTISAELDVEGGRAIEIGAAGGVGWGAGFQASSSGFGLSGNIGKSTGSFGATPLSNVADYQVGLFTGSFDTSYPIQVAPAQAGAAPSVSLVYSSGGVDGMSSNTNNQVSTVGVGWDVAAGGSIQRHYVTCKDDVNPPHWYGDFCPLGHEYTLSLNGVSSRLVLESETTTGDYVATFRLESDPIWRIELFNEDSAVTVSNEDAHDEYWVVTTPDGTRYEFGSTSDSVDYAPVYTYGTTEPFSCAGEEQTDHESDPWYENGNEQAPLTLTCQKAWRWNLAKVTDTSDNAIEYSYLQESNWYGIRNGVDEAEYIRASHLQEIRYSDWAGHAGQTRVLFVTEPRCNDPQTGTKCDNVNDLVDTPIDLTCRQYESCINKEKSPTFYSERRLAVIATQVLAGGLWDTVSWWDLDQSYPDPTVGSEPASEAKLWLDAVTRRPGSASSTVDARSAFWLTEAEDYDSKSGSAIAKWQAQDMGEGRKVVKAKDGDWIKFEQVDFGPNGPGKVIVRYSSTNTASPKLRFRIDGAAGTQIAEVDLADTGGTLVYDTVASTDFDVTPTGVHDLYVRFVASDSNDVADVNWFRFNPSGNLPGLPATSFLRSLDPENEPDLANRVYRNSTEVRMRMPRIRFQVQPLGGEIEVVYGQTHPWLAPGDPGYDSGTNTAPCQSNYVGVGEGGKNVRRFCDFYVGWDSEEGSTGDYVFWNKWKVREVITSDPATENQTTRTRYDYGTPKWHYSDVPGYDDLSWDNAFVCGDGDPEDQPCNHWFDFRGHDWVQATMHDGDCSVDDYATLAGCSTSDYWATTETRFFQGMDLDKAKPGTTHNEDVTILNPASPSNPTDVDDDDWLKGQVAQVLVYKDNTFSTALTNTVNTYYADDTVTNKAWFVDVAQSESTTYGATDKTSKVAYTYSPGSNYQITVEERHGDTATTGDDRNVRTTWNQNAGAWILVTPESIKTRAGLTTSGSLLARTDYLYDGATSTTTDPTDGLVTESRSYVTGSDYARQTMGYDARGRVTRVDAYADSGDGTAWSRVTTAYDATWGYAATVTEEGQPGSGSGDDKVTITEAWNQAFGLPERVKDPAGKFTRFSYDEYGRLTEGRAPMQDATEPATVKYEYSLSSYPVRVRARQLTNESGSGSYLDRYDYYGGFGRLIQTQIPADTSGNRVITSRYWNQKGLLLREATPWEQSGGAGSGFVDPTWVGSSPTMQLHSYFVSDEWFRTTRTERVSQAQGGGVVWTENVTYPTWAQTVDTEGTVVDSTFDAFGNLVEVGEHNGTSTYTTRYKYDLMDRLTEVYDDVQGTGGVAQTEVDYDLLGRKTGLDDRDMGSWVYQYDDLGNLTLQRDGRTDWVKINYDHFSRPEEKWESTNLGAENFQVAEWVYDGERNGALDYSLAQQDFNGGSWDWQIKVNPTSYDANGRVTAQTWSVDDGVGATSDDVSWAYDPAGRVTSLTYPSGEQATYTYDSSSGMPEKLETDASTHDIVSEATWNALGQPVTQQWGQFASKTFYRSWDYTSDTLRLLRIKAGTSSATSEELYKAVYGYDDLGNVTSIKDGKNQAQYQCYGYDDLNRLTRAYTTDACGSYNGAVGSGPYDLDFVYNSIGNLTEVIDRTGPGQDSDYDYIGYGPHAVSAANGWEFTYDDNGNQETRTLGSRVDVLEFDQINQLVEYSNDATAETSRFIYDAGGARVVRISDVGGSETVTHYVGGLYEYTDVPSAGDDEERSYYLFNGTTVGYRYVSGTTDERRYLLTDHLATSAAEVRYVTDLPSTRQWYQPYGRLRGATSNQLTTDHTYTGQTTDEATGLMFYNARYYDPTLRRFISPDTMIPDVSVPQDFNRYSYVGNSPTNASDPSGHCRWHGTSFVIYAGSCNGINIPTESGYSIPTQPTFYNPSYDYDYPELSGGEKFLVDLVFGWVSDAETLADPDASGGAKTLAGASLLGGPLSRGLSRLGRSFAGFLGFGAHHGDELGDTARGANDVIEGTTNTVDEVLKAPTPRVTFGHGARHLEGTGLSAAQVESTILQRVTAEASQSSATAGSFWGRVQINGTTIEYRAYTLPDGTINVGTYYVP